MTTTQKQEEDSIKKFPLQEKKLSIVFLKEKTGEYTVSYNLILTLRKEADKNEKFPENNFEGRLELLFTYVDPKQEDIFLNFKGTVHSIKINDKVSTINTKNCRIYLNHLDLVCNSLNKVVICLI